ncbi:MAG: HAD-IB family phosphatase [Ruminococcus sp.]|nr:HAD-IB family phosphatase [Ruminococcus sp.]
MNVYDFDKTIYSGDSTADFYLFSLRRHKRILLLAPSLLGAALRFYLFKRGTKTQFKEVMYRFLQRCDTERDVADFRRQNACKIKRFYLAQQQPDDVIISASPVFLLAPICEQLGIRHLIASEVDPHTGRYTGENCHGAEKVRRFREQFGDAVTDAFYSDSHSDDPMAKIAQKAFMVKGEECKPWEFNASCVIG